MWLSLGGFHERGHDWESDRRIYNSHIIINDKGTVHLTICHSLAHTETHSYSTEDLAAHGFHLMIAFGTHTHADIVIISTGDIVSVYRKSHLFDVELPEKGVSLKESAFTIPGPSLVSPVQTPIGKV